jgi:hypothetical protein
MELQIRTTLSIYFNHSECLLLSKQITFSGVVDEKGKELLFTTGMNVNSSSHYGNQYGSSSKNSKYNSILWNRTTSGTIYPKE